MGNMGGGECSVPRGYSNKKRYPATVLSIPTVLKITPTILMISPTGTAYPHGTQDSLVTSGKIDARLARGRTHKSKLYQLNFSTWHNVLSR